METESIITLAKHQKLEKKKTREKKKVHGQIHLPLLQSISGQKKYTITRQEESKINGPPTSPLTSIHLHPCTSLSPSDALFLSLASLPPLPYSLMFALRKKELLFFTPFSPPTPLSLPPLYTPCLCHLVIYRFC